MHAGSLGQLQYCIFRNTMPRERTLVSYVERVPRVGGAYANDGVLRFAVHLRSNSGAREMLGEKSHCSAGDKRERRRRVGHGMTCAESVARALDCP